MEDKRQLSVHRGDVYFVHLGENIGSEENKTRPVVVVEASTYSVKSPVFIGAIITSSAFSMPDGESEIPTRTIGKSAKLIGLRAFVYNYSQLGG